MPMRLIRTFADLVIAAIITITLSISAVSTLAGSPALAAGTSTVSVVHGIPGQPVDVYVNGAKTLADFQPSTIAGPLTLPAGTYTIVLTKPGDPITSPIVKADQVPVPSDASMSVTAHLTAQGQPALTGFANDVTTVAAGKARLVVRHIAAAPAVDVRAGNQPVFTNLTNPNEAKAEVAAGTVTADVTLAGTSTVVLGPTDLALAEGTSTIVYAIGSADAKTLAFVVQKIEGLNTVPHAVPAGDGGGADSGVSWWPFAAASVGAILLVVGIISLGRARARARG